MRIQSENKKDLKKCSVIWIMSIVIFEKEEKLKEL